MPQASCRDAPTSRSPNPSPSRIISWPILKWPRAIAAARGALEAVLSVMDGLWLDAQKDLQGDKRGAVDALSRLSLSLAAMPALVRDMPPDLERMRAGAGEGYSTATDLADWLVRRLQMP